MIEEKNTNRASPFPLRRERELRGWSRSYIAQQLEVDVATVGRWEREERLPHPYHRQKLCEIFEKSAQELGFYLEMGEETQTALSDPPVVSVDEQSTLSVPSPGISQGEQKDLAPSRARTQRRALVAGLGGLGAAALIGSAWKLKDLFQPRVPAREGKLLYQLYDPNTNNWINNLAYSPDTKMLAVASSSNITTIWDVQRKAIIYYYPTLNKWVNDISWSRNNFLATANGDFSSGSIQVWEFSQKTLIFTHRKDYAMRAVSWSPRGDSLAFAGHDTLVEIWNPFTARLINHYTYANSDFIGINRIKWSFDARYIAAADDQGAVHVWEVATGKLVTVYSSHQSRVIDITWCPGQYRIASASADTTAHVWDALKGKTIVIYRGHQEEIHGIDWSPDRKYIVSGGYDTTVQIWEALTGRNIYTYTNINDKILTVSWSDNGAMITVGSQGKGVEMWQALL